jgi:hypothetical protein
MENDGSIFLLTGQINGRKFSDPIRRTGDKKNFIGHTLH